MRLGQNSTGETLPKGDVMIRPCSNADMAVIEAIINEAAQKYRGVIPADCWHEPYMPQADLLAEINWGPIFRVGRVGCTCRHHGNSESV